MLDFNLIHESNVYMAKKMLRTVGISFLSLALAISFLSDENLLVRVRVVKTTTNRTANTSAKGSFHSQMSSTVQDACESSNENFGKGSPEDADTGYSKSYVCRITFVPVSEGSDVVALYSNLLLDQYLSLPPPV
ncbi:hypothetical protein LPTSP3_g29790 [Leptospira kobayashii]|uniref:Lipoprotein n=1 Tax=Leptospira kobayashii TaxID=1917830 RepID=A0ABN6KHM3_9LEPT|nr:hypothetical protein [Leptospira kobayashii]BDA80049.1 hypothetical protein LPTSP3_g29790 [Leptospira kobayashii]